MARLLIVLALVAAGCGFESPSFEGTAYRCELPAASCPPGFTCLGGVCLAGEDAAVPEDGDDGDGPPADVDAAPDLDPTFGERPDAEFTNVNLDTSLASDEPTGPARGGTDFLEIDAGPETVTLMRFELSALPTTATVVSATLEVTVFDPLENGEFEGHAVLQSWAELTATWNDRDVGMPWAGPGASNASRDNAVLGTFAPRTTGTFTVTLAPAIVQGWIDAPATNFGFRWHSTSNDGRGGQLRSSEYPVALERPILRLVLAPN